MLPFGANSSPVRAHLVGDSSGHPRDDPFEFLLNLVRTQGDVARYENAYGPVTFFNHPDQVQAILLNPNFERTTLLTLLLGDGLLASERDHWRSQRRLMQPHFHERCVRGFASLITEATLRMLRRWEEIGRRGDIVYLDAEMRHLTLGIILQLLFGHESPEETLAIAAPLRILMDDLGDISDMMFQVPMEFGPSRNARFREALKTFDGLVLRKLAIRRAIADAPRDLLTTLLDAEQGTNGNALTPKQVRDEVVTMIIAGHETTAISLSWACHLLTQNPDVEQRMSVELERNLEGRVPTADDLPNLGYTRMVLEEAMRLYPPVSIIARQAVVDDSVGGVSIPAKGVVALSAYTTHRHPGFWEDPERFDPGRFAPERSQSRHRFAYFPFLAGRHQCLGQPLAMMEGHLILALLAQCCRVHTLPGRAYRPSPGLAMRLKEGFPVRLELRRAVPKS